MIDSTTITPPRPAIRRGRFLAELFDTLLLIGLVYTLVNLATVRFFIEGRSMEPTFQDAQNVLVSRVHYLLGEPQRGDIVVLDAPGDDATRDNPLLIKRLIGLPGETISFSDGLAYVNGQALNEPYIKEFCTSRCNGDPVRLGPDEFFVMGDNRNNSRDSRVFGAVSRGRIVGEVIVRYWPPSDIGLVIRHRFPE